MTQEKDVDESWKESIENPREKGEGPGQTIGPERIGSQDHQVNFIGYITSLVYQVMIFLGDIPSPIDNKTEKNLPQAKLLIDTLVMLRDKTKNNLDKQEEDSINQMIYEIQMRYVDVSEKKGRPND